MVLAPPPTAPHAVSPPTSPPPPATLLPSHRADVSAYTQILEAVNNVSPLFWRYCFSPPKPPQHLHLGLPYCPLASSPKGSLSPPHSLRPPFPPTHPPSTWHLGNLIKVTGVVTRRTGVFPQLKVVSFDCGRCGSTMGPFPQQVSSLGENGLIVIMGPFLQRLSSMGPSTHMLLLGHIVSARLLFRRQVWLRHGADPAAGKQFGAPACTCCCLAKSGFRIIALNPCCDIARSMWWLDCEFLSACLEGGAIMAWRLRVCTGVAACHPYTHTIGGNSPGSRKAQCLTR